MLILFLSQSACASNAAPLLSDRSSVEPMVKTIVLVHGAWGGGWDYLKLTQRLRDNGHKVRRVTLTGLGERAHLLTPDINLQTHITDVVNVIRYDELSDVILVGHSYGGMVITGVADKIPQSIKHLVYMDAFLPNSGERALDYFSAEQQEFFLKHAIENGAGYSLPPYWPGWEETKDVAHPLASFTQKLTLVKPNNQISATYVLTIDPGQLTDQFSIFAERAKHRGYAVYQWATGHNMQRTMVDEYVELLHNLEP